MDSKRVDAKGARCGTLVRQNDRQESEPLTPLSKTCGQEWLAGRSDLCLLARLAAVPLLRTTVWREVVDA